MRGLFGSLETIARFGRGMLVIAGSRTQSFLEANDLVVA